MGPCPSHHQISAGSNDGCIFFLVGYSFVLVLITRRQLVSQASACLLAVGLDVISVDVPIMSCSMHTTDKPHLYVMCVMHMQMELSL